MLRWAIHATALALILAAAEGCGSSSNSAGPDASTGDGSAADGGADVSAEAAEAGPDCGPIPPTGTQLVAATDPLVVFRLTTDHAIYENLTTQEIYGVALTGGGMPSDIGKMTSQGPTMTSQGPTVVYLPTPADPMSGLAPVSAWSPSTGTNVISKSAIAWDSFEYTYDASKDGMYVAYYATTDDVTATLVVSTTDGKTQTTLISGIDLQDEDARTGEVSCYPPVLQFVNDTLIAQYCVKPTPTEDAGTPSETMTIATFTGPSFATIPLGTTGTTFPPFSQQTGSALAVDPTATFALLSDSAGNGLYLYPLAGGNPTTVDPNGTAALFAPNGDILYTTTTNELVRYAASSGTKTPLVTSGLTVPFDLSPDGNWLQAAYVQSSTTGLSDLFIAPAMAPGAVNEVVNTATTSALGFTADSSYSVFGTDFPMGFAPLSYDLQASKTSGGAPTKVLTASAIPLFPTGSKLVSNTNLDKTTGAADIVELDLSTTAAPTVLVSQANPNMFMTATANQVVYSWYCDENAMAGIWALTPP
jgi:hypothetical protein